MRTTAAALILALPLTAAAAAATSVSAGTPRTDDHTADLAPVNSGGSGHVDLHQHGTRLSVDLEAHGLDDGVHLAHIHGLKQAQAECPSLARDTDGNGLVDLPEGLPDYGPVVRTLSQGTSDRGTSLDYLRAFTHLDNGDSIASLGSLDQYAVVVHGVDLDGDGLATKPDVAGDGADHDDNEISMPALCGVIMSE